MRITRFHEDGFTPQPQTKCIQAFNSKLKYKIKDLGIMGVHVFMKGKETPIYLNHRHKEEIFNIPCYTGVLLDGATVYKGLTLSSKLTVIGDKIFDEGGYERNNITDIFIPADSIKTHLVQCELVEFDWSLKDPNGLSLFSKRVGYIK